MMVVWMLLLTNVMGFLASCDAHRAERRIGDKNHVASRETNVSKLSWLEVVVVKFPSHTAHTTTMSASSSRAASIAPSAAADAATDIYRPIAAQVQVGRAALSAFNR